MADWSRIAGGLIEGFGAGMGAVGKHRIDQEAEAVRTLREQNLARFNAEQAMERQVAGDKAAMERQTNQQGFEGGLLKTVDDNAVDAQGNPVSIYVDNSGKPIGDPVPRGPKKGEKGYTDPDGKGGKVKAEMYKIGMKNVFDDVFRSYVQSLGEEGKDLDMSQFLTVNADGSTSFNETTLYSKFPKELADEFVAKKLLVEYAMENDYNPASAALFANEQYKKGVDLREKTNKENADKEKQKTLDDFSKKSGMDPKILKQVQDAPATEEMADKVAAKYNPDDKQSKAELKAFETLNPELYKIIQVKLQNKGKRNVPSVSDQIDATKNNAATFGQSWWEQEGMLAQ